MAQTHALPAQRRTQTCTHECLHPNGKCGVEPQPMDHHMYVPSIPTIGVLLCDSKSREYRCCSTETFQLPGYEQLWGSQNAKSSKMRPRKRSLRRKQRVCTHIVGRGEPQRMEAFKYKKYSRNRNFVLASHQASNIETKL